MRLPCHLPGVNLLLLLTHPRQTVDKTLKMALTGKVTQEIMTREILINDDRLEDDRQEIESLDLLVEESRPEWMR